MLFYYRHLLSKYFGQLKSARFILTRYRHACLHIGSMRRLRCVRQSFEAWKLESAIKAAKAVAMNDRHSIERSWRHWKRQTSSSSR